MQREAKVGAAPRVARAQPAKRSVRKRIKTILAVGVTGVFALLSIAAIYLSVIFLQVRKTLPSIEEIGNISAHEPTKLFFADGVPMAVLQTQHISPIELDQVDQKVIDATIATEDSRFYDHHGIDYQGIVRALYKNVLGLELREGASTITQQLARNLNELGLGKEKRLRRKVAEAILAAQIETRYSKDDILEMYLNTIYYGNSAYGIEAAAESYFHKSSKQLSLSEAAYLAGLPQRPSLYGPNRAAALRRRDQVLARMLQENRITQDEHDKAKAEKLKVYKAPPVATQIFAAPYVVNHVVRRLETAYGHEAVHSGWKVYTTIDSRIQAAAEEALAKGLKANRYANQGALIAIDQRSGWVRAMVGGANFEEEQFNAITQGRRQPGSAFKPIVYAAAIDSEKCDLNSTYMDTPDYPGAAARGPWRPKNYSGKYSYGGVTVLSAIKRSLNTIAVKVAVDAGLDTVIDYAHRMGIESDLAPYPPLALGASAVRPIELCSAYTVFSNGGRRPIPTTISKVLDQEGSLMEEATPELKDPPLKPETIAKVDQALREVVLHGTGTAASRVPEARGKTGTTSNNIDAWFAGYSPELTCVIWVANVSRTKTKIKYSEMPGTTGGQVCAPIWRDFMLKAIPVQQAHNQALSLPDAKSAQVTTPQADKAAALKPPPEKPKLTETSVGGITEAQPIEGPTASPGALSEPGGGGEASTPPPATSTPSGTLGAIVEPRSTRPLGAPSLSQPGGAGVSSPRIAEPGGRPAPPPTRRADSPDDVLSYRLCAETMQRATKWCPVVVDRQIRRKDAPGSCRTHREPN